MSVPEPTVFTYEAKNYKSNGTSLGRLFSSSEENENTIEDIYVINIIREIYDEVNCLFDLCPLDNQYREKIFNFARKLRLAEAMYHSPNVKDFVVEGRGVAPCKFKISIKESTFEVEEYDPQKIVDNLRNLGKISVRPIFHPLIDRLRGEGIADLNLNNEDELNIAKKVVNKGIAKVLLVLEGIPFDDLHFKRRSYKPKGDIRQAKEILAKVEKLIHKLPSKPYQEFLKESLESLKTVLCHKENHAGQLGVCPRCGSKMKYDLHAGQPRTFSGELKPRKICPKCNYTENEN